MPPHNELVPPFFDRKLLNSIVMEEERVSQEKKTNNKVCVIGC